METRTIKVNSKMQFNTNPQNTGSDINIYFSHMQLQVLTAVVLLLLFYIAAC